MSTSIYIYTCIYTYTQQYSCIYFYIECPAKTSKNTQSSTKLDLTGTVAIKETMNYWEPEDNSVRRYQKGLVRLVIGLRFVLDNVRSSRKHVFCLQCMLPEMEAFLYWISLLLFRRLEKQAKVLTRKELLVTHASWVIRMFRFGDLHNVLDSV